MGRRPPGCGTASTRVRSIWSPRSVRRLGSPKTLDAAELRSFLADAARASPDVLDRSDQHQREHDRPNDTHLLQRPGSGLTAKVADKPEGDAPGQAAQGVPEEEQLHRHPV